LQSRSGSPLIGQFEWTREKHAPPNTLGVKNHMQQFWFHSNLFHVDPAEDEETNPFCYGRELAQWAKDKFSQLGYMPEEVFPEDWGWCVMLSRESGMLWLGCSNIRSHLYEQVSQERKKTFVPDGSALTWTVVVGTDKPFWSFRIAKRRAAIERLEKEAHKVALELETILKAEVRITLVSRP
jgi:hypothetical protein